MQTDGSQLASFREIHKNAWLKRVTSTNNNKLLPIAQKKGWPEKWWIVFCVHGDIEPFLEGYSDNTSATTHMPKWRTSLKHTLHVSGSVGPAKPHTEYEFVITLQEGVVRLIAPTWESMQDWVDTLRNKLREMKIISPKENVYSKGPEQLKPRAPTRDPTSPLPAPPPGPIVRVPGTVPSIRPPNESGINLQQTQELFDDFIINTFNENDLINQIMNSTPSVNTSLIENTNDRIAIEISDPDNVSNQVIRSEDTSSVITINDDLNRSDSVQVNRLVVVGEASNSNQSNDILDSEFDDVIVDRSPELLARLANVSGMNICLGDSVIEHRIKNEANNEFFAEFDNYETNSGIGNESTKILISNDNDVKAKYSQVNINAKSTTNITGSSSNNNSVIPVVADNAVESSSSTTCIKVKPQVVPRTFIPKNNLSVAIKESDVQKSRIESNKIKEKPKVLERKKIPYNRSQSSGDFPSNSVKIDPQDTEAGVTNVTIITVSNHLNHLKAADTSETNENDNKQISSSSDTQKERNYVNYPINEKNHNSLPVYLDNKEDMMSNTSIAEDEGIVFRGVSNLEVNSNNNKAVNLPSPGYGHIRHSTTIGVPPPDPSTSFQSLNIPSTSRVIDVSIDEQTSLPSINQSINISQKATISINKQTDHQKNEGESSNQNQVKQDFYESVFTPFSIPKTTNKEDPTPGSSSFYIGQRNQANLKVSNNNKNQTDYEFLSWNGGLQSNGNCSQTAININQNNTSENTQESNVNILNSNKDLISTRRDIINKEVKNEDSDKSNQDRPRGLLIRGLTELSIMSRFRNMGHPNSSRSPLLKNSHFDSYQEVDPVQGTSNESNNHENVKKNKHFSEKLNHIFGKGHDDKAGKDKLLKSSNPCDRIKIESTLRRNWSEHNDRTVLPMVKHTVNLKLQEKKSREPIGESSSPQNATNQTSREEQQLRRRSNSFSESRSVTNENATTVVPPKPNVQNNIENAPLLRPMGLREQQVAKLRGEMVHAGGVRLRLRVGDCPGEAMAMADAYGTVWVCGWKQKTHPLLYNALHIGDRLATVGGVPITSVRQAKRALKDTSSGLHYVELVIKRLPHGRVYALKKDSDNQDLGLITDCATIVGIVPGSPAALIGIPPTGTLTEINGRPLNLLMKKGDSQVKDRLNAIGREVSILVQPTEFVTLLRNSLKSLRSHKDYIVQ